MKSLCIVVVLVLSATGPVLSKRPTRLSSDLDKREAPCNSVTSAMPSQDKTAVLNKHNELRGQVTPSASNMQQMSWDNDLADKAQYWANQCYMEHLDSTDCNGNRMGQNLGLISISSYNAAQQVVRWHNEVTDYTYSTPSCKAVCGHYTQVVYATSTKVGCGMKNCATLHSLNEKTGTNSTYTNVGYLVCNYSPPGNYQGAKPYVSGTSCSKCPTPVGGYKCVQNSCVACMKETDSNCLCRPCENGGTLAPTDCKCTCDPANSGWYGPQCQYKCENVDENCNAFPETDCTSGEWVQWMALNCAARCNC